MIRHLFLLFILLFFPIKIFGQDPIVDTTQIFKEYPKIIPKMEFDSARVSPNGKYALVLKGSYLNGCDINYWNLYENGLNKTIAEYIVILKKTAYFLTYEKECATDSLTYFQNDEKYTWTITKKCPVKDFIQEYNLIKKPKNRTKDLKVTIDILPEYKVNIPWEISCQKVGDSIERIAQSIELKFKYKDKLIYTTPLKYLSNPRSYLESEQSFDVYYKEIQKQLKILNYLYWNPQYGLLFLESNGISFLRCEIESTFFSGWESYKENCEYRSSTSGSDPRSRFELLSKTE